MFMNDATAILDPIAAITIFYQGQENPHISVKLC